MDDLITRIQNINNNIESLKVKKIEDETNAKRYEEDIKECDSQLNELGYKTVEEAEEATKDDTVGVYPVQWYTDLKGNVYNEFQISEKCVKAINKAIKSPLAHNVPVTTTFGILF